MPSFRRAAPPTPPPPPEEWRTQQFGKGHRAVPDPLIEPSWSGVHVIARVEHGRTSFADEEGIDCTAEFGAVAEAVTSAARAEEMILDGFLTVEPTQPTTGLSLDSIEAPSAGQMMTQMLIGTRRPHESEERRDLDPSRPIAFVAVDLLRIDGSSLLDVPLLERKRLLDGALETGELVRVTPFVRPPIGSFIATWRGLGFRALAYKAANSRYLPGDRNDDWSIGRMPAK
jgi:bifunctional non-homologous end joining protein LigD